MWLENLEILSLVNIVMSGIGDIDDERKNTATYRNYN